MHKKQHIINTVLRQKDPFYCTTITSLSGASIALVNSTLNELIYEGKISSHKEGKKHVYTILDCSANSIVGMEPENICTVLERFEYMREIVRMVVRGINPSALIVGRSGVGKTHLVLNTLLNENLKKDKDFLFISGHTSAFGLYKLLHDNRDKFLVFDDCDSAFSDPKSVNILKAALDSFDVRRVSWFSEKTDDKEEIEPYFDFEGKVIFISNLYASRIDEAVRSRAFCMDLHMSNAEVTEHMRNIITAIEPAVNVELKQEVLDYIDSISDSFETYGLRTLIQSIRIRLGAQEGNDWKKMIKIITCKS